MDTSTTTTTAEMTEEEIKKEMDEIMDANEFLRRENALFSAFVWRHDQKTNNDNDIPTKMTNSIKYREPNTIPFNDNFPSIFV